LIDPQLLKSTIKVCMFDQYGTVVDIQTGLVEAATPFLKGKNWPGNPNSFVTWWRRTHFENSMIDALLGKEHTPYREIGERAVAFVMDRAGISHTPDEVHALVAAIERLKPFSEMPTALDRLRTRYKLAVLSNGDPTCSRPRGTITASPSTGSSPSPSPMPSSRITAPTKRRPI
jgi:2-haloacid dehalogenase